MRGISRRFGSVQALRGAAFSCEVGEVHALLGENGAGKSTLMQVLFGLLRADEGTVEVAGRPARFRSPRDAMDAGLGMVHQHFTQVPALTVAENVWLGRAGVRYDGAAARRAVAEVGRATGLALDPDARVASLPVGLRQRLEIVKALARDVRIVILDEPTAVLAPREVDELFGALRRMAAAGVAVVLITHKLREVGALADRVTVLRAGETVLTGPVAAYGAAALTAAMVGGAGAGFPESGAEGCAPGTAVLRVEHLVVARPDARHLAVRDVSFAVGAGEIVGIAAVEGNGEREVLRAVAGLALHEGKITVAGGSVGFVPEDRQEEGLILEFGLDENLMLGAALPFWIDRGAWRAESAEVVRGADIRAAGNARPVRELSGGNQQKLVVARELRRRPALLVAENPTRGLDVVATAAVHRRVVSAAREDGLGVLFHSTDLDEVLALSDRVAVMVEGRWSEVAPAERTRERVGGLMLGAP